MATVANPAPVATTVAADANGTPVAMEAAAAPPVTANAEATPTVI